MGRTVTAPLGTGKLAFRNQTPALRKSKKAVRTKLRLRHNVALAQSVSVACSQRPERDYFLSFELK